MDTNQKQVEKETAVANYLVSHGIYILRGFARYIGVVSPTKMKKEDIVKSCVDIFMRRLRPQKTYRGRPLLLPENVIERSKSMLEEVRVILNVKSFYFLKEEYIEIPKKDETAANDQADIDGEDTNEETVDKEEINIVEDFNYHVRGIVKHSKGLTDTEMILRVAMALVQQRKICEKAKPAIKKAVYLN